MFREYVEDVVAEWYRKTVRDFLCSLDFIFEVVLRITPKMFVEMCLQQKRKVGNEQMQESPGDRSKDCVGRVAYSSSSSPFFSPRLVRSLHRRLPARVS